MSAHNLPEQGTEATYLIVDPGTTKTVVPTKSPAHLNITTVAAETQILGAPTAVGQEITISLNVDGGDLVITQTGSAAINAAGNTTATLGDVGDRITFVAIRVSGTLRWRVKSSDGIAFS